MDDTSYLDVLAQSHLFRRLREVDRAALAQGAKRLSLDVGETLYVEGQSAQTLFFIVEGRIRLSRKMRQKDVPFGTMSTGDYLGIECVSHNPVRKNTATALEPVTLLCIERARLIHLADQAPRFKISLKTAIAAQREAIEKTSTWLEAGEYPYHFDYRHPVFLYIRLLYPLIIGLGSILLFIAATEYEQPVFSIAGVIVILFAAFWGIWNYLDYYNDYFVVTNKRVVWQEKIIGIYDSRQEAPTQAIRAIDYEASWIGRLIGFGNVYVRTFTGGVVLERIGNAQYVMDLVDEMRERAAHVQVSVERETRRRVISEQIGLSHALPVEPEIQPASSPDPEADKRAAWEISFKTRLQQGNTLIFRKHWLILLSKTIVPLLCFAIASAVTVSVGMAPAWEGFIDAQAGMLIAATLALAAFLWAAYHYFDWRNDIYMVTADQVFDIERRPLGREEKKSAPLESILSLTVERKNIVGILFNFGDVLIDAGGTNLIFHNVYDPASAQLDLAARVDGIKRRKEEGQAASENKRLAEWIGEYYELTRK